MRHDESWEPQPPAHWLLQLLIMLDLWQKTANYNNSNAIETLNSAPGHHNKSKIRDPIDIVRVVLYY